MSSIIRPLQVKALAGQAGVSSAKETDIDEREWLRVAATNPAFDFLKEPEEDIYTLADGKPFYDQK